MPTFPTGKLPAPILEELLAKIPSRDPSVIIGPGIGMDCAVITLGVESGDRLLVLKSDPITFATDAIGHYLVQVNANDIATTGAIPRWLLATILLPEGKADRQMIEGIMGQIDAACAELGIALVGGHTEITHGLDRPLAVGSLIGEVARADLVTPRGSMPGDRVLLTKGIPIEGTSILAREFGPRLEGVLTAEELEAARDYLHRPGISIVRDARIALEAGRVTAMHDPTEGGLFTALWELAEASRRGIRVEPSAVPVPALSQRVCQTLGLDPFATIASGALLLTVSPADRDAVIGALNSAGILCAEIGEVLDGPVRVERLMAGGVVRVPLPARDELARFIES